jgi:hypothetical protein
MRVTNGMPLGCSLLPSANCKLRPTLKVHVQAEVALVVVFPPHSPSS